MKKIIRITNYHGSVSGYLNYYKEIMVHKSVIQSLTKESGYRAISYFEQSYLNLRNATGSVNSFEVVELEESEVDRLLMEEW